MTKPLGLTFSRFEAWDAKTPEEHVDAITETVGQWYLKHTP
jgi:hypothetical protein